MKIYTKTGDDGTTFLPGKGRVVKWLPEVELQGDLDELNAWVGVIRKEYGDHNGQLKEIQGDLLEIGAQLARGCQILKDEDIAKLERWIDKYDADLKPLTNFILPSERPEAHVARAVCRRTERNFYAIKAGQPVLSLDPKFNLVGEYLNRLSDYLFTLARYHLHKEEVWVSRAKTAE